MFNVKSQGKKAVLNVKIYAEHTFSFQIDFLYNENKIKALVI